jgi:hypothetical protein
MEKFLEIRAVSQELHKIDATAFPAHESEEKTIEEAFTMVIYQYVPRHSKSGSKMDNEPFLNH